MRISPIDIQQKQFKSRPFGYEKTGVDQFLELLAEELERLMRKNQDLLEELARTNVTLAEMREREETLKETLVITQKITEELKSTARREVAVMIAEAEIKAERLMRNAEERRMKLIEEVHEIKRQKIDFEVSLHSLLQKHIRMLDLNNTAIEQQDTDSRLLEEPLPFMKQPDRLSEECASKPVNHEEEMIEEMIEEVIDEVIEEAEFTETDTVDSEAEESVGWSFGDKVSKSSFEIERDEENE
ncbi:MAG: DivIVA domain-containing protein [Desulfuromonadales bacterium]